MVDSPRPLEGRVKGWNVGGILKRRSAMEGTLVNLIIQIIAGAIGGSGGQRSKTSAWARPATPSAGRSAAAWWVRS